MSMVYLLLHIVLLAPCNAPGYGLAVFVENMGGPGVYTGRWPFDYDGDQDVDLRDFAELQNEWTDDTFRHDN